MSAKKEKKAPEAEKPEGAEGEAPAKKKMSGKTLILFIVAPALLVVGGGTAAAMMLMKPAAPGAQAAAGHGAPAAASHGAPAAAGGEHGAPAAGGEHGGAPATGGDPAEVGHAMPCEGGNPCYYMLPKQIVNLASNEEGANPFLEIELALESADPANFNNIQTLMPRLKDQYQSFLRELRVEDLNGSAGNFRLRQELLKRFNIVMAPAHVDAVLIESLLIQGQ
jgi:flagellar FliL protein